MQEPSLQQPAQPARPLRRLPPVLATTPQRTARTPRRSRLASTPRPRHPQQTESHACHPTSTCVTIQRIGVVYPHPNRRPTPRPCTPPTPPGSPHANPALHHTSLPRARHRHHPQVPHMPSTQPRQQQHATHATPPLRPRLGRRPSGTPRCPSDLPDPRARPVHRHSHRGRPRRPPHPGWSPARPGEPPVDMPSMSRMEDLA